MARDCLVVNRSKYPSTRSSRDIEAVTGDLPASTGFGGEAPLTNGGNDIGRDDGIIRGNCGDCVMLYSTNIFYSKLGRLKQV